MKTSRTRKSFSRKKPHIIDVYYFYTSWCPYCKQYFPVWKKFKSKWNNKIDRGYLIKFHEVDCELEKDLASRYNIIQYPTILRIKYKKVLHYEGVPELFALSSFLTK
jgi:thiol-disulfide isomerase/thioredoxin